MCTFEPRDAKTQHSVDLAHGASPDFWVVSCHVVHVFVHSVMVHD